MTDLNTDAVQTTDVRNIYHMGHHHGRTTAYFNADVFDEVDRETFVNECLAGEENSRQFSPNELWISALNEREDADEAWEEYERGVYDGITAYIEAHNT